MAIVWATFLRGNLVILYLATATAPKLSIICFNWMVFFLKMGQSRPLFDYVRLFYVTQIKYKLMKALVGTRTPGGRMEGVDKSTELWRNPQLNSSLFWNRNKPFQSLVKLTFPRWSFKRLLLWPWTDATNSSFIKFGWKWPNIGLRIGANTKNVPILKHELVPDICVQIGKGCFSSCGENY